MRKLFTLVLLLSLYSWHSVAQQSVVVINSFPYLDNFNGEARGWFSTTDRGLWQRGAIAKPNGLGSDVPGLVAWTTGQPNYFAEDNSRAFLLSPRFNFTNVLSPTVSFDIWVNTQQGLNQPGVFDGAQLQYTTDNGNLWTTIDNNNAVIGGGWYNTANVPFLPTAFINRRGWAGVINPRTRSFFTMPLLAREPNVQFRFVYGSGPQTSNQGFGVNVDGVIIDNFGVSDAVDIQALSFVTPNLPIVNNTVTVPFRYRVNFGLSDTIIRTVTIDGGPLLRDTIALRGEPGDTLSLPYTITRTNNDPFILRFGIRIRNISGDQNLTNDTTGFNFICSPVIASPFNSNFETNNGGFISDGTSNSWAYGAVAKTVITGAASGTNAWVTGGLGTTRYNNGERSFVYSPFFTRTANSRQFLGFKAWWDTENLQDGATIQFSTNNGNSWQTIGRQREGANWFTSNSIPGLTAVTGAGQNRGWTNIAGAGSGRYVDAAYDLSLAGISDTATRVQFRFAFGANGNTTVGDGFAFDDFNLSTFNSTDVAVVNLVSPDSLCGASANTAITVSVTNRGNIAASNVPVTLRFNNQLFNSVIPSIPVGDTVLHTFSATLNNLVAPDTIRFWVSSPEVFKINDTSRTFIIRSRISIASFPYNQDFEAGDGGWNSYNILNGRANNWQLGTPTPATKPRIGSAASGTNAWVTNLAGNYERNNLAALQGPCFDFGSLSEPFLQFNLKYFTQLNTDGLQVQYSTNSGRTWTAITSESNRTPNPFGWYNTSVVAAMPGNISTDAFRGGWSDTLTSPRTSYLRASVGLPQLAGQRTVLIRFVFVSNGDNVSAEGIAIDDISITERPNNDFEVLNITGLNNACQIANNASTQVLVRNNRFRNATGTVTAALFNQAGAQIATATATRTFTSREEFLLTFPAANLGTGSVYNLRAVLTSTDANSFNDTLSRTLVSTSTVTAFPYTATFDGSLQGWATYGDSSNWVVGVPNKRFINRAINGSGSVFTSGDTVTRYKNNDRQFLVSPCFNFSTLDSVEVSFNANIFLTATDALTLQYTTDNGITWVTAGRNSAGWMTNANLAVLNNANIGSNGIGWFVTAAIQNRVIRYRVSLPEVGGQNNVRFRFVFATDAANNFADGITIDDFTIRETPRIDLEVFPPVLAGLNSQCLPSNQIISVRVRNLNLDSVRSYTVGYTLNGTVVSSTVRTPNRPIRGTVFDTVSVPISIANPIVARVGIFVRANGVDINNLNDTLFLPVIRFNNNVTTYPYISTFEANDTNFVWTPVHLGRRLVNLPTTPLWIRGATNKFPGYRGALIGNSSYYTGPVNGNATEGIIAAVESPCYNLAGLTTPVISFTASWELEENRDAVQLQYTTNNGVDWFVLNRSAIYSTGWYNGIGDIAIPIIVDGRNQGWTGVVNRVNIFNQLPTNLIGQVVRFRFVSYSNIINPTAGFAFDNFRVYNRPVIDVAVNDAPGLANSCEYLPSTEVNVRMRLLTSNVPTGDSTRLSVRLTIDRFNRADSTFSNRFNSAINRQVVVTNNPSTLYSFPFTNLNIIDSGTYRVTIVNITTNDGDPTNDTLTYTFFNRNETTDLPFFTTFGDSLNPETGGFTSSGNNANRWVNGIPRKANLSAIGNVVGVTPSGWAYGNLTGALTSPTNTRSYLESPCFSNLGVSGDGLYVSFWYHHQTAGVSEGVILEYTTNDGTSWVKLDPDGRFRQRNFYNQPALVTLPVAEPSWADASAGVIDNRELLRFESNLPDSVSEKPSVRFRLTFGNGFAGATNGNGFALYNFEVNKAIKYDASMLPIPNLVACDFGNNENISTIIRNTGSEPIQPNEYRVSLFFRRINPNGSTTLQFLDTVRNITAIAPNAQQTLIFTTPRDLSRDSTYRFVAIAQKFVAPFDQVSANDSVFFNYVNQISFDSFPVLQDFNTNGGDWVPAGINVSWRRLNPAIAPLTSNNPAWITDNNGRDPATNVVVTRGYNTLERSTLTSPCFNLDSLVNPTVVFDIRHVFSDQDGATFEYSTNAGASWAVLNPVANDLYWFNTPIVANLTNNEAGFGGNSNGLRTVRAIVPKVPGANYRFRFKFESNNNRTGTAAGMYFDNFRVQEADTVDARMQAFVTPSSGGCGFLDGDSNLVTVRIFNGGSKPLINPSIRLRVRTLPSATQIVLTEVVNDTIPSNTSATFTFSTPFNFPANSTFALSARIIAAGDVLGLNDSIAIQTTRFTDLFPSRSFRGFRLTPAPAVDIPAILPGWSIAAGETPGPLRIGDTRWTPTAPAQNAYLVNPLNGGNGSADYVGARLSMTNRDAKAWMISQPFEINGGDQIRVRASYFRLNFPAHPNRDYQNIVYDDTLYFRISTDCGTTWNTILRLGSEDFEDTTRFYTLPVGLFFGRDRRLGIYGSSGSFFSEEVTKWTDFVVDSLELIPGPPVNLQARAIANPDGSCGLTDFANIAIRLRNLGNTPATNYRVTARVNNRVPVSEVFTDTIMPLEEKIVTLSLREYFGRIGSYNITAFVDIDGDTIALDDTVRRTVTRYSIPTNPVNFAGFNGRNFNTLYPDWIVSSGPNGQNETLPQFAAGAIGGNVSGRFELNNFELNHWIISPEVEILPGTEFVFNATIINRANQRAALNGAQLMEIVVSDNCGRTWSNPLDVINNSRFGPTIATQFKINLDAYINRRIKVAIRIVDNPASNRNNVFLNLDDIFFEGNLPIDGIARDIINLPTCAPLNTSLPITMRVFNNGNTVIEDEPVIILVNTGTFDYDTLRGTVGSIQPGEFEDVFMGEFNTAQFPAIEFIGSINLVGDNAPSNNAVRAFLYSCTLPVNAGDDLSKVVNLFPNPNSGAFTIGFKNRVEAADVTIINNLGQVVYTTTISSDDSIINTNLPAGMYSVKISTDGKTAIKRMTISR